MLWLLEELGAPYEMKRYRRDPKTKLGPPELLAVHPLGKSPVIVDGNLTIAETGAIVEYLVNHYGAGRLAAPTADADRLQYTYWMHFAEGSAMPPAVMKLLVLHGLPSMVPFSDVSVRGFDRRLLSTRNRPRSDAVAPVSLHRSQAGERPLVRRTAPQRGR